MDTLIVARKIIIVLLWLPVIFLAHGQNRGDVPVQEGIDRDSLRNQRGSRILGDTVKSVYGARTTRFTYERNFKFNDLTFYHPDTIPDNLHRFTDLERNQNFIQNLGNLGTALRSLFYTPKTVAGRTSGYHAFDPFYTGPDQIRYFDTRSPYTDIKAVFGGGGRAITDIVFSLNDSIHLNLGFGYNNIRADKQLAYLSRGDRNVENTNWNIFGFLRPRKIPRYLLLFNLTQMKHVATEQGGIVDPEIDPDEDASFFSYQDANVILDEAESYDKRGGLHLFQQYDLDSVFQVYHSGTLFDQILRYNDIYDLTTSDSLIYQRVRGEQDTIRDRTAFREWINEFGFKGYTKKFAYTLFYRLRNLQYDNAQLGSIRKDSENYLGGTLRQQLTQKIFLTASGEYLLGGNYLLSGHFTSEFFDARYTRVKSKPTYLSEFYQGRQTGWSNTFADEVSDNIYGEIKLNLNRISFRPLLRFNRISGYQYYGENKAPLQASGDLILLSPGFHFDWQLAKKWKWSGTLVYTRISGSNAEVYRIPELMANSQIAYKNVLFDGKMIAHAGLDLHYRSAYRAYGYNPTIQQFYLQNDFHNDAFVKMDLFLNFKVQDFIFFIKSAHFNQGLTSDGYFITPFFTGTRQTLDMGARWSFYD